MENGKWRAKRMIQGKVKTKVFPTKHEAKKWEAEQEAEVWVNETCPIRMTCLIEIANAYLDMAKERFSKKTIMEKRLSFRHLFKLVSPELEAANMVPAIAQYSVASIRKRGEQGTKKPCCSMGLG
jgi:hypothetical protein